MTRWKKEKNHFNYYVTNQRNNPLIYIEAKNTPDAKTENLLKVKGFKFDYNESLYVAPQTNELRLFVYVDLHFMNGSVYNFDSYTKAFLYDQLLRYAKKHLEKWDQKEKSKREKNRFNRAKREIKKFEKDL